MDEKIVNHNFEACPIFNEKDHLKQSFKSKADITYSSLDEQIISKETNYINESNKINKQSYEFIDEQIGTSHSLKTNIADQARMGLEIDTDAAKGEELVNSTADTTKIINQIYKENSSLGNNTIEVIKDSKDTNSMIEIMQKLAEMERKMDIN